MKKLLTFFLALVMLLSCLGLASCGDDNGKEPNTPKETEAHTEPDDESIKLGLPEDLKFDGEFTILTGSSTIAEVGDPTIEEQDTVSQSLLDRDYYVEDRLGITFQYKQLDGGFANRQTFSDAVRNSVQGGSKNWDLIGTYSMVAPNLALNNVVYDLRTLEYIDFEKTWYPQFMVDSSTINDKTYFISGDISLNMLYQMMGVVFSADTAKDRGIDEDELYQMVYDNEWTLENWFEMCEDLGQELGGDGVWDNGDFYPIVVPDNPWLDSFYFATGNTLIEENNEGKLIVSDDPMGESILTVFSTIFDGMNTYNSFRVIKPGEKLIMEDKCIFAVTTVAQFRTTYVDHDEQFRILPFPKFAEGSDTPYQTMIGMGHFQYCIPNDISDPERAAAVLEALSYGSYIYVVPAAFEETMQLRYAANSDVSEMFDIMRNGRNYDVASLFYMSFEANGVKDAHSMFRNAVLNNITNWTSNYKNSYEVGLNTVVGKLNEFYSK